MPLDSVLSLRQVHLFDLNPNNSFVFNSAMKDYPGRD